MKTLTIHQDVNVRQKDYEKLDERALLVTKVFATIQGEGPLAGQFAIFVRLAGCNLGDKKSCPWCDTDFKFKQGVPYSIDDLLALADQHRGNRPKTIVLTGGEPLLQNPWRFIQLALSNHWTVQVETNGYFWSEELDDLSWRYEREFLVVVSPKVNARYEYPTPSIRLIADCTCLKVLVDDDPTSPYHELPHYVKDFVALNKPVYISPINHYLRDPHPDGQVVSFWGDSPLDLERCRANHRYALRIAMTYGYRLNIQQHLWAEAE